MQRAAFWLGFAVNPDAFFFTPRQRWQIVKAASRIHTRFIKRFYSAEQAGIIGEPGGNDFGQMPVLGRKLAVCMFFQERNQDVALL